MNKLLSSTFAKIAAVFIIAISASLFAVSGIAILYLNEGNAYLDDGEELRERIYREEMSDIRNIVSSLYVRPYLSGTLAEGEYDYLMDKYSSLNSNISVYFTDYAGSVLFNNYEMPHESALYEEDAEMSYKIRVSEAITDSEHKGYTLYKIADDAGIYDDDGSYYNQNTAVSSSDGEGYEYECVTFTGYVRSELTAKDKLYFRLRYVNLLVQNRYVLIIVCGSALLLTIILFIFLLCSAGHKKGVDGIYLNLLDKVPLDLYIAFVTGVVALLIAAFALLIAYFSGGYDLAALALVLACVCALVTGLLALSVILTFATRLKKGEWWRNNVIFMVLRLIWKVLRLFGQKIAFIAGNIPLIWKTAIVYTVMSLLELTVIICTDKQTIALWWFAEKIVVTAVVFFSVIDLKKLSKASEEIASGNLEYKVDTRNMIGDFKRHAESLSSISDGMQKAVNDRMKSEHFKTELITNVSHDLKTPLTSIVNYVDLMKKEDIQPEKAKEYLEVLDRQSKRLQKLTVDLLEASKASTGNIQVNAEKTDINVLLSQAIGEYEEKFNEKGLEVITSLADEGTCIKADGRLMWRVLDNIINNICKYAMENTRVYVNTALSGGKVSMEFKNVSKYPLNISSDELMERFVRGDASRHTDGSGLGLSIAGSLAELQGGKLFLTIDGDLFKVRIVFDEYKGE